MNAAIRFSKCAAIIAGLMMILPVASLADKGGKPNKNSVAVTAACIEVDGSAHVYSCKALSNVVLWCDNVWVKHDDIVGADGEEIYDGVFDCGVDADGNPRPGPITMVAIKSGSQKNAKHYPDGYTPVADAPSGSGLFVGDALQSCGDPAFVAPLPGECDGTDDGDGGDDGDDDEPVLN